MIIRGHPYCVVLGFSTYYLNNKINGRKDGLSIKISPSPIYVWIFPLKDPFEVK
jgi:hypothetical protein